MPMTANVLKTVNRWGQISRTQSYGALLEFFNRNQRRYDWDNEELVEDEGLVEKETGPPSRGSQTKSQEWAPRGRLMVPPDQRSAVNLSRTSTRGHALPAIILRRRIRLRPIPPQQEWMEIKMTSLI